MDPRIERRAAELLARHGWRIQRTVDGRPNPAHVWDEDRAFAEEYRSIARRTLVAAPAAYVLHRVAEQVRTLDGDWAEVGVYQGGTAALLAARAAAQRRTLHLFDTFTGMPPTDWRDLHSEGDFGDTSLGMVQQVIGPNDAVRFHPGMFPETAASLADRRFSLVHVDVDIYRSVLDCCTFFMERLVGSGVMIFDDYGWTSCPGARLAVDEFFADRPETPVYLPTGQALVIGLG